MLSGLREIEKSCSLVTLGSLHPVDFVLVSASVLGQQMAALMWQMSRRTCVCEYPLYVALWREAERKWPRTPLPPLMSA